jgi:hypothetical protein
MPVPVFPPHVENAFKIYREQFGPLKFNVYPAPDGTTQLFVRNSGQMFTVAMPTPEEPLPQPVLAEKNMPA